MYRYFGLYRWEFFVTTLLLFLFVGFLPFNVIAATFPDVAENTIHYNAIEYLREKVVVSGYPDNTFKPDQQINRAEALKMVMIASSTEAQITEESTFSDVNPEEWFYDHIQKAVSIDLVEGYDDGTFRPATNINVAESLKIVFTAFSLETGDTPTSNPYPDVETTSWYSQYANYSKLKQIIEPSNDGKLHAEKDITRGEFAQLIYRIMYVEENNLDIFPLSTDWQTHYSSNGEYTAKYPYSWKQIDADGQTIFWEQDVSNRQLSWARIFPNSATVVIAVDENPEGLSLDAYLALIEYGDGADVKKQTLNNYPFAGVYIPNTSTVDYYLYFPNGHILVAYTQIGEGPNKGHLTEEIRNIIGSIRHGDGVQPSSSAVTTEEIFLSDVRKNILVDGKGQDTLDLFNDLVIIETDTIGIGTGPVDYYYSEQHDVTLKYERNADTILAISEEKGSTF